ncbi:hypothetical protein YC2023_101575 [Brassica napus]
MILPITSESHKFKGFLNFQLNIVEDCRVTQILQPPIYSTLWQRHRYLLFSFNMKQLRIGDDSQRTIKKQRQRNQNHETQKRQCLETREGGNALSFSSLLSAPHQRFVGPTFKKCENVSTPWLESGLLRSEALASSTSSEGRTYKCVMVRQTGVRHSTFECLRLGRSSQNIAYGFNASRIP